MVNQEIRYSITWFLNNFSYSWQKKNEAIDSPIFSVYLPEETKWKLQIFPRGSSDESCIAFYLHREQDCNGPENVEVKCSLECLGANSSIIKKGEFEFVFPRGDRWGYPNFFSREIAFKNKRSKYLPQDILTVRCIMKLNRLNNEKPIQNRDIFARTIINVEKKHLRWSMEKFSSWKPGEKKILAIKSAFERELIKIDLFLTGGQCSKEQINLNILPVKRHMKFFTLKTFVLNTENEEVDTGEFESFCEFGKSSTLTLKLSRDELLEDKDVLLPNNVLSLSLELAISTGFAFEGFEKIDFGTIYHGFTKEVKENHHKSNTAKNITGNSCALISDLKALYKEQSLCDVNLQAKTSAFPAHISILGARSPVFRAMFSTDMKEKLNGRVDLSDLKDETVYQMLLYLYTDKLEEVNSENIIQLYKVADKYAIVSLKDECSLYLKDNLDLINACRTLTISDLHEDGDLKIITQDFILKNAKEIFKSEEWKLLADINPKLALETALQNWKEE